MNWGQRKGKRIVPMFPEEIRPFHLMDQSLSIPLSGGAALGTPKYAKTALEGRKHNLGDR